MSFLSQDAFTAFHLHKDQVSKYLNSLLIGELAPDQPSSEPSKNQLLVNDFRKLRATVEKMGLLKPNSLFFFLMFVHIMVLDVAAWLTIWYFGSSLLPFLVGVALFTVAQTQMSWFQHDLGHLSVLSSSRWNHVIHKILMSLVKGMPAQWWNYLHFQHHAKPNCFRKDPDLNMHPILFALGKKLAAEDLALIVSYNIRVCLIYVPLMGFKWFMAYYWLSRLLESCWFTWVSQMNHIPMNIDYDKNMDWVSMQLQATCNVEQSLFNDWFTGHLNFQIEHHLFPTMPRHNYWKVAPLVKSLCAKHGIDYQIKPLLTAFADILQFNILFSVYQLCISKSVNFNVTNYFESQIVTFFTIENEPSCLAVAHFPSAPGCPLCKNEETEEALSLPACLPLHCLADFAKELEEEEIEEEAPEQQRASPALEGGHKAVKWMPSLPSVAPQALEPKPHRSTLISTSPS
ncbi:hypothetical protein JD844_022081 [Phrynosoma platyrhinos]|uniref:Fatty acid desaturase domain-containing protein n=1 Tax=Phrynosoma platyrhinos TaxID=52577 RepID=A0ABQ7SUT3_PHRPL|nr:hypothetical protein JD844_022081 [Phrynosoma platyrhinos]